MKLSAEQAAQFQKSIWSHGRALYRDLPWRNTRDPYEVLVSEVMLQQTQVARVLTKWPSWLELFPTIDALASAPQAAVLEEWQGLGYNRRAIALHRCAQECSERYGGQLPQEYEAMIALPGIGPATAAGVRAFAYDQHGVYLETNVRTVFIHELFPGSEKVPDSQLIPLIEQTCDASDPRGWYYALLDYGSHLKKTLPNPSRRSAHHAKQSKFEGSRRQKRAWLLRAVMGDPGVDSATLAQNLAEVEVASNRVSVEPSETISILEDLAKEGFIVCDAQTECWRIP